MRGVRDLDGVPEGRGDGFGCKGDAGPVRGRRSARIPVVVPQTALDVEYALASAPSLLHGFCHFEDAGMAQSGQGGGLRRSRRRISGGLRSSRGVRGSVPLS